MNTTPRTRKNLLRVFQRNDIDTATVHLVFQRENGEEFTEQALKGPGHETKLWWTEDEANGPSIDGRIAHQRKGAIGMRLTLSVDFKPTIVWEQAFDRSVDTPIFGFHIPLGSGKFAVGWKVNQD